MAHASKVNGGQSRSADRKKANKAKNAEALAAEAANLGMTTLQLANQKTRTSLLAAAQFAAAEEERKNREAPQRYTWGRRYW